MLFLVYCFSVICASMPTATSASPCTPGKFRVRLSDCPIQALRPRDGDLLNLEFVPIVIEFPLLYTDGDDTPVWQHDTAAQDLSIQANLVQKGVVSFQGKTFKTPDAEASIPSPTIYWPKGSNVKVSTAQFAHFMHRIELPDWLYVSV
jgi:hypothetical protein